MIAKQLQFAQERRRESMAHEFRKAQALPRPLAAVTAMATLPEMPQVIPKKLGEVWAFVGEHKIISTCHNVVVYVNSQAGGNETLFDMLCGVEVHEVLPRSENVQARETPGGPVAATTHWGPYDQLAEAHNEMRRWLAENNLTLAGPSWEVYGDWSDDPAKLRTDIFYLLSG
jgi:effector-binding domain-containing protein